MKLKLTSSLVRGRTRMISVVMTPWQCKQRLPPLSVTTTPQLLKLAPFNGSSKPPSQQCFYKAKVNSRSNHGRDDGARTDQRACAKRAQLSAGQKPRDAV